MQIRDFEVEANEEGNVILIPFGCVHWDHPNADHELFKEMIHSAFEKNALLIGMGDYRDFARTHLRMHIKSYTGDETSLEVLDTMLREKIQTFAEEFSGLEQNIIGLGEGNHGWQFQDGTTDTQYLCQLLNCAYLGDAAFTRLYVKRSHDATESHCYTILSNHGVGTGGRYIASDVGQMERNVAPNFDADLYLSSHTHKKFAVKVPVLGVSARRGDQRLIEKTKVIAKTGAFLKGYVCNQKAYVEKPLFGPTELGWITFTLNPFTGKQNKGIKFEY